MTRRSHYKNEWWLKLLVVLAGVIALITQIFSLVGYAYFFPFDPYFAPPWAHNYYYSYYIYFVIILIIGMVISVLTIMCGMRKSSKRGGEILPFHWLTFIILAVLEIVFGGGILACVLLVIAFLIALIEDL